MKTENKGNTAIIKDEGNDLATFVARLSNEYKTVDSTNVIIDLLVYDKLTAKEIATFLPLVQQHKKAKKSFVLVANAASSATGKVVVVPTVQEAIDTIEMDEIERDLGF